MKQAVTTLIERFGLVLLAGACAALLHLYGGLSVPASMLLGFAFTIIGMWLYGLNQVATFKPYRLIIGIRYASLWEDLKLTPVAENMKLENFTFTALSPSLFARSDDRLYSTKTDIYKDVPCGAPAWLADIGDVADRPTFFLRPHREGYEFGVRVQEEWWKRNSSQLGEKVRHLSLAYDHTITLGMLPYGYIPEHVRKWNEPVTLFGGFDRKQKRWKNRMAQSGWSFDDNFPTHLEHRYLGIGYYEL